MFKTEVNNQKQVNVQNERSENSSNEQTCSSFKNTVECQYFSLSRNVQTRIIHKRSI